ncbi:hypothetical protein CapIbe_006733 [Capra ibex]
MRPPRERVATPRCFRFARARPPQIPDELRPLAANRTGAEGLIRAAPAVDKRMPRRKKKVKEASEAQNLEKKDVETTSSVNVKKKRRLEDAYIVISDSDGEEPKEENGLQKTKAKLSNRAKCLAKRKIAQMTEEEQFALALKMSEQEAREVNSQEAEEEELLRKAIAESLNSCRPSDASATRSRPLATGPSSQSHQQKTTDSGTTEGFGEPVLPRPPSLIQNECGQGDQASEKNEGISEDVGDEDNEERQESRASVWHSKTKDFQESPIKSLKEKLLLEEEPTTSHGQSSQGLFVEETSEEGTSVPASQSIAALTSKRSSAFMPKSSAEEITVCPETQLSSPETFDLEKEGFPDGRETLDEVRIMADKEVLQVDNKKDAEKEISTSIFSSSVQVSCPLCDQGFPPTKIERHAMYCSGLMGQDTVLTRSQREALNRRDSVTTAQTSLDIDKDEKCYLCKSLVPLREYQCHVESCLQLARGDQGDEHEESERVCTAAGRKRPQRLRNLKDKGQNEGRLLRLLEQSEYKTADTEIKTKFSETGAFRVSSPGLEEAGCSREMQNSLTHLDSNESPIKSFVSVSEATDCLVDFKKQLTVRPRLPQTDRTVLAAGHLRSMCQHGQMKALFQVADHPLPASGCLLEKEELRSKESDQLLLLPGGHPSPSWNHMDSIGSLGLQQGEGAPGCPQEGLPCPSNTSEMVQECLQQFKMTGAQLRQIQTSLLGSMEQALRGQAGPAPAVRMLPTYVGSIPHGTEQGDFVVLELGATGASLRVLWVTLTGVEGHKVEPRSQEFVIPQEVMLGPGQQLFDFAARCLSEFLDVLPVGNQGLQLEFSFSFPCHQTGLDKSTLISWTKGFKCSDVEGQDVVQLLRDAIQRQGAYSIDVVAVVNDTVGTMMGCEPGVGPCEVGLVVDTGTNACYMEEARHVAVLDEDRGRVCISIEWGSFSDEGALGPVQTIFDRTLDHESLNPGAQRFEKMIGGLYLGELVRLVLAHLAQRGALFGGHTSPVLRSQGSILLEHVAEMEDPSAGAARVHAVLQDLGLNPKASDAEWVQCVCMAVCTRAAQLCAAALAAVLSRLQHSREQQALQIAVATGGRVFERHPRFLSVLRETVMLLAPDCNVSFIPSVDGGGRGVAMVTAVAARLAAHRRLLEETLAPFRLTREQLAEVQAQMREAMAKGLQGEASSLRMLPTYVRATPDGSERGDFLALDLGGTNFRVLLVRVATGGVQISSQIYSIPECVAQGSGQQLFDHIVDCIVDFQQKQGLSGQSLPLGFTFSFPCRQMGLDQGILLNWTKGFNASDCEGQDVVCLLREAIRRRQAVELNVVAIVNDTVGTMMSCGYEDPHCEVGLIVGTGTNACYMEELRNVASVDGDSGQMCINTEWGAFGDDGSLSMLSTRFDACVDQASINPGKQRFEKMISGMYLGEIVRHILLHLTSLGVLFRGQQTQRLQTRDIFKTKFLSEIESDSLALRQVRAILEDLGLPLTSDDALMVLEVCQAVSKRAAQLCGAGVAAVVEKIRENRGLEELTISVGVDGTLYKLHPHFSSLVAATVRELAPHCVVTFLQSEDGSGKGAALVTAVACRLAQTTRV